MLRGAADRGDAGRRQRVCREYALARRVEIQAGSYFRKTASQTLWRVESVRRLPTHDHATLRKLDDPTTVITVSVEALRDRRLFEPTSAPA